MPSGIADVVIVFHSLSYDGDDDDDNAAWRTFEENKHTHKRTYRHDDDIISSNRISAQQYLAAGGCRFGSVGSVVFLGAAATRITIYECAVNFDARERVER